MEGTSGAAQCGSLRGGLHEATLSSWAFGRSDCPQERRRPRCCWRPPTRARRNLQPAREEHRDDEVSESIGLGPSFSNEGSFAETSDSSVKAGDIGPLSRNTRLAAPARGRHPQPERRDESPCSGRNAALVGDCRRVLRGSSNRGRCSWIVSVAEVGRRRAAHLDSSQIRLRSIRRV